MKSFCLKYLYPSLKSNKGLREVFLFIAMSVIYKISRYLAIGDVEIAFKNAYDVVSFEKTIGIFYEIPLQQYFLNKLSLVKLCNQFYTALHVPSMIAFFVWFYQKQRSHYFYIRNCFLIANFLTLFIFIGFPCAPPRMLNEIGFVDTLLQVSNVNLYSGVLSHLFNQYAAMPSMHFGTALMIGVVAAVFAKKFVIQIGLLLYPLFVLIVIVVTGNHFFLDALVGGFITALPFAVTLKRKYLLQKDSTAFEPGGAVLNTSKSFVKKNRVLHP